MSEPDSRVFRRLLVPLGHAGADAAVLRAAADFAVLLSLDLHGIFVEDEALLTFAGLPFAREIRLPTHDWQPLAAERLEDELRHAAEQARHLLEQTLASRAVAGAFAVRRGDPFGAVAALCTGTDIVGYGVPAVRPRQAQGAPHAVLVLPNGALLRDGPVAVVLGGASDATLELGSRIAVSGGRGLLLLMPGGPEALRRAAERAAECGAAPERIATRPLATLSEHAVLVALGSERECLIVLGANSGLADAEAAERLGTARTVPVLATSAADNARDMAAPRHLRLAEGSGFVGSADGSAV